MMKAIIVFFSWYPLFGIPALVGGAIVWLLVRKRVHLKITDKLLLVLPWATWLSLMFIDGTGKSLSNLIEASILGGITVVLFTIRSLLEVFNSKYNSTWSLYTLLASCVAAFALWAFVPGLPE
jgi:hypothetical protein